MSKIVNYLKYEGISATVKKIVHSVKKSDSKTVFFEASDSDFTREKETLRVVGLKEDFLNEFENIKFFEHIVSGDYLNSNSRKLLLGYIGDVLVGYVAAEHGVEKKIHGLGRFSLTAEEAWIGPTWVRREFRGQGISSVLIREMMDILQKENNIMHFYTAINAENISSQKAFVKNSFKELGTVTILYKQKQNIVEGSKLKEKFQK